MAIVNATPDSFYASSRTQSHRAVAERVESALNEGAAIIDIGGYSSRPDADDVPVEEEWNRVDMALSATKEVSGEVAVSIDTFRAEIVRRAYEKYGEENVLKYYHFLFLPIVYAQMAHINIWVF